MIPRPKTVLCAEAFWCAPHDYVILLESHQAVACDCDDFEASDLSARGVVVATTDGLPPGYSHALVLEDPSRATENPTCALLFGWRVHGPVLLVPEGRPLPCFYEHPALQRIARRV